MHAINNSMIWIAELPPQKRSQNRQLSGRQTPSKSVRATVIGVGQESQHSFPAAQLFWPIDEGIARNGEFLLQRLMGGFAQNHDDSGGGQR